MSLKHQCDFCGKIEEDREIKWRLIVGEPAEHMCPDCYDNVRHRGAGLRAFCSLERKSCHD